MALVISSSSHSAAGRASSDGVGTTISSVMLVLMTVWRSDRRAGGCMVWPQAEQRFALGVSLDVLPHRPHVLRVTPGERRDRERLAGIGMQLLGHRAGREGPLGGPLEELEPGRQVLLRPGPLESIAGQPHGADEPGIAGHPRGVLVLHLVVVVVLVACHAADVGLHPEAILHLLQGGHRLRVVGRRARPAAPARRCSRPRSCRGCSRSDPVWPSGRSAAPRSFQRTARAPSSMRSAAAR